MVVWEVVGGANTRAVVPKTRHVSAWCTTVHWLGWVSGRFLYVKDVGTLRMVMCVRYCIGGGWDGMVWPARPMERGIRGVSECVQCLNPLNREIGRSLAFMGLWPIGFFNSCLSADLYKGIRDQMYDPGT